MTGTRVMGLTDGTIEREPALGETSFFRHLASLHKLFSVLYAFNSTAFVPPYANVAPLNPHSKYLPCTLSFLFVRISAIQKKNIC